VITIERVLTTRGVTGYYSDDQAAILEGASRDGFGYVGTPLTPGMFGVRQPGEAVSVMLLLSDGQVALGDCASVQYSGVGGRAQAFSAATGIEEIERLTPLLLGRPVGSFRDLDRAAGPAYVQGHPAVAYGVSQALLHAAALAGRRTMAEQVQLEYALSNSLAPVPIFAQSGDGPYDNVDKMILRQLDVLPHGLINSMDKVGPDGATLLEYVAWVAARVQERRPQADYRPVLHFDLYGTLGILRGGDLKEIASDVARLVEAASPFHLQVEGPVDLGGRAAQIEGMAELRELLRAQGTDVTIVADEWCNSLEDVRAFIAGDAADMIQVKTPDLGSVGAVIEALLHCRDHGVRAYSGGTCNETDRSAQVTTHVAVACGAAQTLAKPGMGVDEGYMIVRNEMSRLLALAARSRP
jgi:methylaspartate ammonia-lyase